MEYGSVSEWNEQQNYGNLYFYYSHKCRAAQRTSPLAWWQELDAKLVHACGILNDAEIKEVEEKRQKVRKLLSDYRKAINRPSFNSISSELYEELRELEVMIDQHVNSHMPFLKLQPQFSIDDI